jgi:hypothetical protein
VRKSYQPEKLGGAMMNSLPLDLKKILALSKIVKATDTEIIKTLASLNFFHHDGFMLGSFFAYMAKIGATDYRSEDAGWSEAKKMGFTHKRWITVGDGEERQEHAWRHNEEQPINERFSVQFNGSEGPMYPRDPTALPEDIDNCRCELAFFNED